MYCECNCGQITTFFRGNYKKYISGHNGRGKPKPNPKIKGINNVRWKRGRVKKLGYWHIWKSISYLSEVVEETK